MSSPFKPLTYRIDDYDHLTPRNVERYPEWTSGDQPLVVSQAEQLYGWGKFALGVGALTLLGRHQFTPSKKGWDYLIAGVRTAEEYSPGRVLRTFQISHLLSPLESPSLQSRYFSPEIISKLRKTDIGQEWLDHHSRLIGRKITSSDIMEHGFRFERGSLLLGETGSEVLLKHASVVRNPSAAGPRFAEGLARSLAGGPLPKQAEVFTQPISFINQAKKIEQEAFMFMGGQTRLKAASRFISGYGTSLVERINQLARAPSELPIISGILQKIPIVNKLSLGVVPSSGLKTLGKITGKLGILGYGGYLAYQEVDHRIRQTEAFDNTILAEGLTAGIATIWTRGQVASSKLADFFGLHRYREAQEEIAPGSTELSRLLAFPILGALGGVGISYAQKIARQVAFQARGLPLEQASLAAGAQGEFFKAAIYKNQISDVTRNTLSTEAFNLLEQQTKQKVGGWEGRLAQKIAAKQQQRGVVSSLLNLVGQVSPGRMKWVGGALLGTAAILPFIPGALVPSERPEELEAIYSGEQKIPIRAGRWWEAGRSPYEGTHVDRYRHHWYPRMLARAKEKAIWGEDEPSPFRKWWIENVTYNLEKRHYYERPYVLSGTFGEDIPFLGPIIAATIGRLIKPPVLMHTDQWMQEGAGGILTKHPGMKHGESTLPGDLPAGSPISPYGIKGVTGEQIYRLQDMIGLPGFTSTAIKEQITGSADVFDQEMQLESARRLYGAERQWWDEELGGLLGLSELQRRLYPHRRRQIELYNPIRNLMPEEWIPGPGEKAPDFLHGDPMVKIPDGELRLPGVGYAALHPELQGVDPADYPLFHRFSILADISPYSDKYKEHLKLIEASIRKGEFTEERIAQIEEIKRQVAERKKRKEFSPYRWKERERTPIEEILEQARQKEERGFAQVSTDALSDSNKAAAFPIRAIGRYWETLTHSAETPLEFLTPVSPASKLVHMRTAVEDYERRQVWGTPNAFWGHPIRDFIRPFLDATKHALGSDTIPSHVQEKRDIEEYFDILKYVKHTRLKNIAEEAGDIESVKEFETKRRQTLFGINPFTPNYSQLHRALPRRERDYFAAFTEADMEERARILKMVPENEQALMTARWKLKDAADMKKAIDKGLLNEKQIEHAETVLNDLYQERQAEGFPKTEELWAEYVSTRYSGESYGDWYRRTKLLEKRLAGRALPGPDWVGFCPTLDLDDIKAKIVLDEGKNTYDYDIWPDQLRMVARRPAISQAAQELVSQTSLSQNEIRNRIAEVLNANKIRASHVALIPSGRDNIVDLQIEEDRGKSEVRNIRRMLG